MQLTYQRFVHTVSKHVFVNKYQALKRSKVVILFLIDQISQNLKINKVIKIK